jgi:hypothetical protein
MIKDNIDRCWYTLKDISKECKCNVSKVSYIRSYFNIQPNKVNIKNTNKKRYTKRLLYSKNSALEFIQLVNLINEEIYTYKYIKNNIIKDFKYLQFKN